MSIHYNLIGVSPPLELPVFLTPRFPPPEKLGHGFIGRDVNDPHRYVLLRIDYPTGAHFLLRDNDGTLVSVSDS